MSIGGNGGVASNGGNVLVQNDGAINVSGFRSSAIFAQSTGGGGGNGGDSMGLGVTVVDYTIGGKGGAAGNGGTVEVALFEREAMPSGGHYVVIEVADNGIGMDASTQELMFEPFFTTKGDHGTGLGLSIVQQIVRHAGGHIEVDSTPGQGTRIRLCLPGISNAA